MKTTTQATPPRPWKLHAEGTSRTRWQRPTCGALWALEEHGLKVQADGYITTKFVVSFAAPAFGLIAQMRPCVRDAYVALGEKHDWTVTRRNRQAVQAEAEQIIARFHRIPTQEELDEEKAEDAKRRADADLEANNSKGAA